MTEIKTAQAWGPRVHKSGRVSTTALSAKPIGSYVPCVVVHGPTEAEVHEAAALRSACRELGIETVEQVGELVTLAQSLCDASAGLALHKDILEPRDRLCLLLQNLRAQRGEVVK